MNAMDEPLPVVLIIDELPPVVRMLELELGFHGLTTQSTLMSEQPVATAEQIKPSGIILGALLPTPECYDVLQQLKKRVDAPVLFLYGSGIEADGALALEMGADDVLA